MFNTCSTFFVISFHVFSCIFSFLLLLFSCLTVCDKNNVKTMQKVTWPFNGLQSTLFLIKINNIFFCNIFSLCCQILKKLVQIINDVLQPWKMSRLLSLSLFFLSFFPSILLSFCPSFFFFSFYLQIVLTLKQGQIHAKFGLSQNLVSVKNFCGKISGVENQTGHVGRVV